MSFYGFRQASQMIASLKERDKSALTTFFGYLLDYLCQFGKSFCSDLHSAEQVVFVGIEAC